MTTLNQIKSIVTQMKELDDDGLSQLVLLIMLYEPELMQKINENAHFAQQILNEELKAGA